MNRRQCFAVGGVLFVPPLLMLAALVAIVRSVEQADA